MTEEFVLREPLALYGKNKFTEEEYMEIQQNSEEKLEFYQGEIFVMPYPGKRHAVVHRNLYSLLCRDLKGKPCQPYSDKLRIHIPKNTLYTYPDFSVVCDDIMDDKFDEKNCPIEPTVIFEIMSPSTRNYDQGDKFRLYRDIDALQEYALVDSSSVLVSVYTRNKQGFCILREYKLPEDRFVLPSIDLVIQVSDLYQDTRLH